MMLWQKQASAQWLAMNEAILDELASIDLAIISHPGQLRSLVQVICHHRARAEKLIRNFGGKTVSIPDDWWKAFAKASAHPPIRVGRQLRILSGPDRGSSSRLPAQAEAETRTLIIPAATAFGTGEHSTTAMSLRLLEETTRNFPVGWRLLDAGTGSGILALAARKLRARTVLGIDNDPGAVTNARHNARLNQVTQARFIVADVLRFKPSARFEVVTANLFSELLIASLPVFRRALRPQGLLIASGILREQTDAVLNALDRAGFELGKKRRRGKWVALQALGKK
jgi:ribosomal protein L11 methyltransferase